MSEVSNQVILDKLQNSELYFAEKLYLNLQGEFIGSSKDTFKTGLLDFIFLTIDSLRYRVDRELYDDTTQSLYSLLERLIPFDLSTAAIDTRFQESGTPIIINPDGGIAKWGFITGNINDQTDLNIFFAKLDSPTFIGTPVLPTGTIAVTQDPAVSNTTVATTAYVHSLLTNNDLYFKETSLLGDGETDATAFYLNGVNGLTPDDTIGLGFGGTLIKDTSLDLGAFTLDITNGTINVPTGETGNNAVNYSQLVDSLPSKVLAGLNLSLSGLDLTISPGSWRIHGVKNVTTVDTHLTIDSQDATQSRYDTVYADMSGNLGIVSGTLSLTPFPPSLTTYQLTVANILITPTSISIEYPSLQEFVTTNTSQTIDSSKIFNYPQTFNGLTYFNAGVNLDDMGSGQSIFNSHYVLSDYSGGGIAGLFNYTSVTDPSTNYLFGFDASNNYLIFGDSTGRHRLLTDLDLQTYNGISIDGSNRIVLGGVNINNDTFLNSFIGNTFGISTATGGEATEMILTPYAFHFNYTQGTTTNSLSIDSSGAAFTLSQAGSITGIEYLGNGVTVYDQQSLMGMGYDADYSSAGVTHYGNRWIPDKGYNDSRYALAGGSTNIYNSDGSLTGNRTLTIGTNSLEFIGDNGTYKLDTLMDNTAGGSLLSLQASDSAGSNYSTLNINAVTGNYYIEVATNKSGLSSSWRLDQNTGVMTITDGVSSKGAQYNADYSSANSANPRWIPDKAYVDSVSGGGSVPTTRTLTINGTTQDLSADRTWTISTIAGNAGTATALQTARNIQGVSFDGTANINILNGTGFVKASGTTISYDNSTYLTTSSASSTYAPLASPSLTGTPLSVTGVVGDNSTQIATDAFVYQNQTGADPNFFYPGSLYKQTRISLGLNSFLTATSAGNSLGPLHIAFIGDSRLGISPNYILDAVSQYGKLNSIGFVAPYSNIYGSSITWSQSGASPTRNDTTSAQTWGIAGSRIDLATGNTWSVQPSTRFPADKIRIFYNKTVGGGTFSYTIDGGAPTNINTDPGSGGDTLGIVTISTGLANQSSHTVLLTGVSGSSRIYGIDFQNQSQDGYVVDILQSGGSKAQNWATSGVMAYTTQYLSTNGTYGTSPAAVVIWLDLNDATSSRTSTQYIADIRSIISNLALPTTSSPLLVTYMPQMTTNTSGIEDTTVSGFLSSYRTELLKGVQTDGWSVIDAYKADPSVPTMYANGYYVDNQHFTSTYATHRWSILVKSLFSGYLNQYTVAGNYPSYMKRSLLIAPNGVTGFGLSTESSGGALSETNTGWYGVISNSTNCMNFKIGGTEYLRMGSDGSTNTMLITAYPTSTFTTVIQAQRLGTPATRAWSIGSDVGNDLVFSTNNSLTSFSSNSFVLGTGNANILAAGTYNHLGVYPNVNQSGSAGYTGIRLSALETATGSGTKLLLDLGTNTAANNGGTHTSKFKVANNGDITTALASRIFITEGTNGIVGQTVLVAGTKAITITGLTTSSRAFVQLVSQGGTVTTTVNYEAVCTSNTLTINAVSSAGGNTLNTADTSTLNYIVYN